MAKSKKQQELEQQVGELTADLQRLRADFENYRKRSEIEKTGARQHGQVSIILKLLPVVDNIERATSHLPEELRDNAWAQGIVKLSKNLEQSLANLNIQRIKAMPGTKFDPGLHEAIQMEDGEGDNETIVEELQAGYMLDGAVIRHSMVKVAPTNKKSRRED